MKVAVPLQTLAGETRVALTPTSVKKLRSNGIDVVVEAGCGRAAHHQDDAYQEAGAEIAAHPRSLWSEADLVATLHAPESEQLASMRKGAVLIGMFDPYMNHAFVGAVADAGITSFSMELMPRISRAQPMDVLSSQANIAGYEATILAAEACPKIFPMMITAAGTIAPARVLVIGAGVAGLQAIATAKRLGAIVEAYDIRPEVEEQILSLGARFVKLPSATQEASDAGGYAREQSDEQRRLQTELMAKHVVSADAVISTAALFGRPPPMLIPRDVVERKQPGSVIVDLAASDIAGRGNCELTQPGARITTPEGVVIEGCTNLPALAPVHSSHVYANNMLAFLQEILDEGQLRLNLDDELHRGPLLSHEGKIMNDAVEKAVAARAQ
jgi:NAD(P) transhydrogenase subunit alpha